VEARGAQELIVRNQATVGVYIKGGVSTVCSAVYIRREKKR
jgi:hypothetical protein